LTFRELRLANIRRLPLFTNKHGARAHAKGDGSDWSPAQWFQAVVGELGEYANFRKKYERGDLTEEEFKYEAARELADAQTYLDILAFRLGIDLGVATINKFNEVSRRVGCEVMLKSSAYHK
jgi:NTP pyrophosphatase (non-canonical NTP hydrolase)